MRLPSVLRVLSALISFNGIVRDSAAQTKEISHLELRVAYGDDATELYRAAAEKGDTRAQFEVGLQYLFGHFGSHVTKDPAQGMLWIRKSAAQHNSQAQNLIGCLLHRGGILAKDEVEAAKWFRKAAEQGDAFAQSNLGYCYQKGEGVAKDMGEAVKWFRMAAKQGEVSAQRRLGLILEAGEGVPKDCAEAAQWFFNLALQAETRDQYVPTIDRPDGVGFSEANKTKPASSWRESAEAGDARAQYEFGGCYENGHGVGINRSESVKWYRASAQGGYAPAQFLMGYFYQEDFRLQHDSVEIIRWYRKAADQGHAKAQYNLGCYYGRGETIWVKFIPGQPDVSSKKGIPGNPVEAVKWYRMAAEQGHVTAQYVMGKICHSGNGIPQDPAEAVVWWRKAAKKGHPTSQFNLGVMLFHGRGTDKDFVESAKWFRECSMQKPRSIDFCGVGKPVSRPMVDGGIQTALVPLSRVPEVR
jgi:TPR repeat protein